MTNPNTGTDDETLAEILAQRTGELLLRLRDELGFGDPVAMRGQGDRQAHEYLMAELSRWRTGDAVLSEEDLRRV